MALREAWGSAGQRLEHRPLLGAVGRPGWPSGSRRLSLPGSWFCACSFHHTFSCVCICVLVTQSCPTLCDHMDHSLPGSSVHWILQDRILEWVAMPSSSESSQPRDRTESPALQADCLLSKPSMHMCIIYSCPFIQISPQALCIWPQSDLCVLSESLLFTPRPWEPGLVQELLSSQLEPSFQTLMSDCFSSHVCV